MSDKLLVAAIDFGTTYSGYAFSFSHEYASDQTKIQTNTWIGGGHISLKALSRKTLLDDEHKKPLEALTGGLRNDRLILALEPEAASFWCKTLPVERLTKSGGMDIFQPGKCYIVLDLGGGTVDITVHQVQGDGSLTEVAKASGGAWGGTQVDAQFQALLEALVGKGFMTEYQKEFTGDFLDMMREFEVKKRTVTSNKSGMITMRIPASLVSNYKTRKGRLLVDDVRKSGHAGKVDFKRDKILIDAEVFKGFFDKSVQTTIAHVREILKGNDFRSIDTMLLVGGFAESEIVQNKIKETFLDKKIIIPNDSGLVVVKGAVLFGHNPNIVTSRISKYTYGTEIINTFVDGVHPEKYRVFENGRYKCRYLFEIYVRAGEAVPVNAVVSMDFISDTFDVAEGVGIYASSDPDPQYVTEKSCFKLGSIVLEEARHRLLNEMQFGGTEFTLQITDLETGVKRINCFDFLSH
ncbi:HS12B-like protein [Mya arenaria]|uniref:HS12B-like protein n=1 Tax=Mya arenaria TaxID=6604 RepID=A0ABY7E0E9_MYAAR|nr:HS12B-like protein [Mya arenaria]